MPERATPAGSFFAWRDAGVGRRAVDCLGCGAETRLPLLVNLLEALCQSCGRNLALERARELESRRGAAALRDALEQLGLSGLPEPSGGLTDALIETGALRRDLRLHLELAPEASSFRYTGTPLRALLLPAELEQGLERQRAEGGVLSSWLAEIVRERVAANVRSVGLEAGLPAVATLAELDPACARQLSPRTLAAFRAIPVREHGPALVVAMQDPLATGLLTDLEALAQRPVHGILAPPDWIERALLELGVSDPSEVETTPLLDFDEPAPLDALDDPFLSILLIALEEGADEVLVEPTAAGALLRFRVRGALRAPRPLAGALPLQLVERLEAGGSDDEPIRVGALRCEVSGLPVRVTYRILQGLLGPAVTLVLDAEERPRDDPGLGELGLGLEALARFERLLTPDGGLLVLAAPPQGGATVAYRAVLARAARLDGAITSLEATPERPLAGVTQLAAPAGVQPRLRALLQPPPDWLGLDAPLDRELALLAVEAALCGTTAVLTVSAPNARAALLRLEACGLPPDLLRACVRGVLARRVVPQQCPDCRIPLEPTPGLDVASQLAIGCPACAEQGTRGRLALAECWLPAGVCGPSLRDQALALVRAGEVPLGSVIDLLQP